MADINKFSLGKDGKLGEIDFSKIKSGLKESELLKNNAQLKSVFDRLDKNGDGQLDRKELDALHELIAELSGDDNLSIKEARKYDDENGKVKRSEAKLFIEFLNKMAEVAKSQGVKDVQTDKEAGKEIITYEDGHTEEVLKDGSVIITVKDGKKTTKTLKDSSGNVVEESVVEDDTETRTFYADGKKTKEIITKDNTVETVNYDSDGKPKDKTVSNQETEIKDSYEFENNEFVLKKRFDSKNNSVTIYDGDKETTTQINGDTKSVTVKENGELVRTTNTRKNENNETERTDTLYDGDDFTENFYLDDVLRRQKKSIDGKEYQVTYDKDGNTERVIVQNGESLAMIAKRFGCSVQDLIKANASKLHGRHPNVYFVVGEEIKIPKTLDADMAELNNRKSKEEAIGEYKAYAAKIEEQKRAEEERIQQEAAAEAEKAKQAEDSKRKKEAKEIAQEIYNACDDEAAAIGKTRFRNVLKRINADNIVDVLKAYKEIRPEESIIAVIANEKGSPVTIRCEATKVLAKALYDKGIAIGVNKEELDKLLAEFNAEAKYQYIDKITMVNVEKMESILDAMLGVVIAKMQEAEKMQESEAIEQTKDMAKSESEQATKDFDVAREDEGWIAKASDTVCGWFGCKTIKEMRAKLGKRADDVVKLIEAKDEAEFKKIFKEVFGVEFDAQKVAAYNQANENYMTAVDYSKTCEALQELHHNVGSLSEKQLKELIKEKLRYNDAELEVIIYTNAQEGEDVKDTLVRWLYELEKTYKNEYANLTKGASLESMANDIELIKKGLFGTSDIAKEVAVFNDNMKITEAVGTGVLEIAGTIALGLIPGTQGLAAARIAAMTAKYGKWAKVAVKGMKVLQASAKAATATSAILVSDGRGAEEIAQHLKMNVTFAAAGTVVGELAPFVAKTLGLSSAVAKELTEDVMDVAVSYFASQGLGIEYGKTDAGVDFIVGLIMARVAHMKLGKSGAKATNSAVDTPNAKTLDKATSNDTAHASEVKVGKKKAETIKTEVEELLKKSDISGEELAKVRHEISAIQDRDLRRSLLKKVDEAAEKLNPTAKAQYDAARKAANKADVDHIFARHNELKNSDMRVLNEYIKNADNVEVLNELKTKLKTKEHEFGGVTQSYKTLYEAIDNKIKKLNIETGSSASAKAEEKAEAPKTEQKAEAPKAEEAPKSEKKAEAPKTEQKAEAPKAEKNSNTDKASGAEKKSDTSESAKEASKAEGATKTKFAKDELKTKLGRKLYRSYRAIENAIEKMKNMADFTKIYNRINVKFNGYKEVATELIGKLKLKAKQLGLNIEKHFDDIKAERANRKTQAEARKRAEQAQKANDAHNSQRTYKKGQIGAYEYHYRDYADLYNKMLDLNLFDANTCDKIYYDLLHERSHQSRVRSGMTEYCISMNNGKLTLEKFDISAKYDIHCRQIDDFTLEKTFNINHIDDAYFALVDELNMFDSMTQNHIVVTLSEGKTCRVFDRYGVQYEFNINRSGKITVTEFEYVRYQNARARQSSNANSNTNTNANTNTNRNAGSANNARNYGNMSAERRNMIEDLKYKIREKQSAINALEEQIQNLQKKFVLPAHQISEYKALLGIPDNVEITESVLKKAYNKKALETHPDKGGSKEAFQKVQNANELLKKHYDFDGSQKAKAQSDAAELRKVIEENKKQLAEYEAKINKLMSEG